MAGMPPQDPSAGGAPAPAAEAPAEQGQDQGGKGGSLPDLLNNINQGLNILSEVVKDSGKGEEAQALDQIVQMYGALVDKLSGGGSAPAAQGMDDAMAGGNPKAAPAPGY